MLNCLEGRIPKRCFMFLRCFTTFYSVLFVYSYLCSVELSRRTDLEALFYDVLRCFTTFYSVLFVYSYLCYVELSNCVLFIVKFEGPKEQIIKQTKIMHLL